LKNCLESALLDWLIEIIIFMNQRNLPLSQGSYSALTVAILKNLVYY